MKWGVRRDWMSTSNPTVAKSAAINARVANAKTPAESKKALAAQTKFQRSLKKKKPDLSSEDAKVAAGAKAKAKKSGAKTLTNKELKDLVTRMNLEQQYSQMTSQSAKQRLEGAKFVVDTLTIIGKNPVVKAYASTAAKQVAAFIFKR